MNSYLGLLIIMTYAVMKDVVRWAVISALFMIVFTYGLYFMIYLNNDSESMINEDSECLCDSAPSRQDVFEHVFQTFIGVGDMGSVGCCDHEIVFFVQFQFIVGMVVLVNLLINIMGTTYNQVLQESKKQVLFNRASRVWDITITPKTTPVPLNTVPIIISVFLHILFFIPALVCKLNGYNCVNVDCFKCLVNCYICNWCHKSNKNDIETDEPFDYRHLSDTLWLKKRKKILQFFLCFCCYFKDFTIHHKNCYCILKNDLKNKNDPSKTFYIDSVIGLNSKKYTEKLQKNSIDVYTKFDSDDVSMIESLTVTTQFCQYCYQPFDVSSQNINQDLVTPFYGLQELISIFLFIIIYPFLLVFFIVFSILENIGNCCFST